MDSDRDAYSDSGTYSESDSTTYSDADSEAYSDSDYEPTVDRQCNKSVITTKCNHTFHVSCINTWLHYSTSCPIYRTEIDDQEALEYPREYIDINTKGDQINATVYGDNGIMAPTIHFADCFSLFEKANMDDVATSMWRSLNSAWEYL